MQYNSIHNLLKSKWSGLIQTINGSQVSNQHHILVTITSPCGTWLKGVSIGLGSTRCHIEEFHHYRCNPKMRWWPDCEAKVLHQTALNKVVCGIPVNKHDHNMNRNVSDEIQCRGHSITSEGMIGYTRCVIFHSITNCQRFLGHGSQRGCMEGPLICQLRGTKIG